MIQRHDNKNTSDIFSPAFTPPTTKSYMPFFFSSLLLLKALKKYRACLDNWDHDG